MEDVIREWLDLGLEFHYIISPHLSPFNLPPRSRIQIPRPNPVDFQGPEGVLLNFTASFNNPLCGIDIELYPGYNTRSALIINNLLAGGLYNQPWAQNVRVPPWTAPGIFIIEFAAAGNDQAWKNWARLYVMNTDTVAHVCLGLSYSMVILDEPRPKNTQEKILDSIKDLASKIAT